MSENGSCLKKLVVKVALFWSKSNRSRFYLKSAIFKQARKVTKYLECVCKKTLLQKAFKNCPQSHSNPVRLVDVFHLCWHGNLYIKDIRFVLYWHPAKIVNFEPQPI